MFENHHIQRPAEKRENKAPSTSLCSIHKKQMRKVSDHIFMVLLWAGKKDVDTKI